MTHRYNPLESAPSPLVISDTDLHGLSCGINALYSLGTLNVFSHFEPQSPMRTTPDNLANVITGLGKASLYILDIPIDARNPKAYVDALTGYAQYKGPVWWGDHHGHSEWVATLAKNGINAVIYGSSYDLSMSLPRIYGKVDSFTEEWALVGALADFDESIAHRVSENLEALVAEYADSAFKQARKQLMERLGITEDLAYGNIGALARGIVEKGIEASQFLEVAKEVGSRIPIPEYKYAGDVVYTLQPAQPGMAWKLAWKLCLISGHKYAMVPTVVPGKNQLSLIIATYWRLGEQYKRIVEQFIADTFPGRLVVGHPGARSVQLMDQGELQKIPMWAERLHNMLASGIYVPKVTTFIPDASVVEAVTNDYRMILNRLTEILETMRQMYSEYLSLKKEQVELLRQTTDVRRRAD